MSLDADIAANLAAVRARIGRGRSRAGRDAGRMSPSSRSRKRSATTHVRAAHAAGQQDFGENKVQEGLQKIADTSDIPLRWHLIGHLQSNKARKAAPAFAASSRSTRWTCSGGWTRPR